MWGSPDYEPDLASRSGRSVSGEARKCGSLPFMIGYTRPPCRGNASCGRVPRPVDRAVLRFFLNHTRDDREVLYDPEYRPANAFESAGCLVGAALR